MLTPNTHTNSAFTTPPQLRRWIEGGLIGLSTVALATVPKVLFSYSVGRPTPFLLYFLPVLFATLRGGWVAGVFTSCVASGAAGLFFVVEMDALWTQTLPRIVIFGVQALVFVFLVDSFVRERLRSRKLIGDLSETRDRLNGILSGTADGITVHDAHGVYQYANESAAQLLGLGSASKVIGVVLNQAAQNYAIYDQRGNPSTVRDLPSQVALTTGQPAESVVGFRRLDAPSSAVRWLRIRANPVCSKNGSVNTVITIFYDITETRQRDAALALAQEWFQIALKSIGDAVITTDEDGVVNMANRVAEVLLGKPASALHHRPVREVFEIFDEPTRAPLADPVAQVLRSGTAFQLASQALLRRTDGTEISVDNSAAPIRDPEGNLRGVILVFRDVSSKRQRERQQALLARVSEELNASLDYRAALPTVVRSCIPLMGDWCAIDWLEGERLERAASAYADPDDEHLRREVSHTLELFAQAKDQPQNVFADRFICIPLAAGAKQLGTLSLALGTSKRTYSLDDHAVAASLADRIGAVVERARLFEAMNLAKEQAIAADRTKSDFLAMLGHELRNPLAPIQTALEVLRISSAEGAHGAEFQIIDRQLRHLVRLVDDLLDISRITHGRVELNRELVDVANVIERAREVVWPPGSPELHHLHVAAAPHLYVMGDPVRLAQVLTNLLINACKYAPQGSHIWVDAFDRSGSVVITIRDEGIGIEPEMLQRVFDTFVQEPQALDRSRGGLGLGLSIVKGLVTAHGGRVSAHSQGVDKGSVFEVTLPRHLANDSAPEEQATTSDRPTTKRRVLVVDDNVDAAEVMAKLLRKFGHTVFIASSPVEALETVSREPLDIALLDIGLPQMSGYELGRRLRELKPNPPLPLVAITGYGQADDHSRSMREGFFAHLVKPVMLEDLHQTLNSLP